MAQSFKATYTGLLKLFLDQVPSNGLSGVVAVPLMLGAGPGHAMAPELLLKPVLVELGATARRPASTSWTRRPATSRSSNRG